MFVEKTQSDNSQELKIKRESLGLSLQDVFQKTRIRYSYLQAIENNEFHLLPAPVYTKNFIKTYAKFLDVDEKPIMKDYDDYINEQKKELVQPQENPPEGKQYIETMSNKKSYWGLLFVLIIVFIIWLVLNQKAPLSDDINYSGKINVPVAEVKQPDSISFSNATSTVNQQTIADSDQQTIKIEKGPSVNNSEQSATLKESVNKNVSLPLQRQQIASVGGQRSVLFISAIEETWVRVKAGENPSFQVLLKPGEKFESNAEVFNLDVGNAGGIKLQYKGKYVENLGKRGEVIHVRLP